MSTFRHRWTSSSSTRRDELCAAGCGVARVPHGKSSWKYRAWPEAEPASEAPPCHLAATIEAWLYAQPEDRLWTAGEVAKAVGLSRSIVSGVLPMLADMDRIERFGPRWLSPTTYRMSILQRRRYAEMQKAGWQPPEWSAA